MQAADGPNSSQLERHQTCVKTTKERPLTPSGAPRTPSLGFEAVSIREFKALVNGDRGLIVHGPSPAFWLRCHAAPGVQRARFRSESHPPSAERALFGTRSSQTLALSLSQ
jgi:hypothetical protein